MQVYHDFFWVPGSRSTFPDTDPDPGQWYGSGSETLDELIGFFQEAEADASKLLTNTKIIPNRFQSEFHNPQWAQQCTVSSTSHNEFHNPQWAHQCTVSSTTRSELNNAQRAPQCIVSSTTHSELNNAQKVPHPTVSSTTHHSELHNPQ